MHLKIFLEIVFNQSLCVFDELQIQWNVYPNIKLIHSSPDDGIRQSEGFKNVNLGNVISATVNSDKSPFLSEEDQKLMEKFKMVAHEVQVKIFLLSGA